MKKTRTNWIKSVKDFREKLKTWQDEQASQFPNIEEITKKKTKTEEGTLIRFSPLNIAQITAVAILVLVFAQFLGHISEILLIFFVSILFSAALDPTVDALERRKIPRSISILSMFFILIAAMGFFASQLIPLVSDQLSEAARGLSSFIRDISNGTANYPFKEQIEPWIASIANQIDPDIISRQIQESLSGLASELDNIGGSLYKVIAGLFKSLFNFILALVLTYFLVVDENAVDNFFLSLFPSKHTNYIVQKSNAIKHKIGHWMRGQALLIMAMFFISWIIFSILGLEYALTLAMMAGLAELLPVLGPILAGIPAILVALNSSPVLALVTLGFILFLQQIESGILVPLIMKRALGLSPIIVILSLVIGFSQFGIVGGIIAVPVATSLSIFVVDYAMKQK